MKRVLIAGANSYIGCSFGHWAKERYADLLSVESVSLRSGSWRSMDFSSYDVVFHVAGIAHADTGNVPEEERAMYYAVNTDLAIETCKKARAEGVKQFVFMSSAIVYGDSAPYKTLKRIGKDTVPSPENFYGDSKWQADQAVRELSGPQFTVTVIRSPMVYGKGCKGNYRILSNMARRLLFFPDVQNERSMIFIDNLCEFLCQVMIREEGGVFFPQNSEYTVTSQMVKAIAGAAGHKIIIGKALNWTVGLASHIPGKISGLTNKAFGNMSFEQALSEYDFEYRVFDFKASIERTENG